jgi:hypothetical protein
METDLPYLSERERERDREREREREKERERVEDNLRDRESIISVHRKTRARMLNDFCHGRQARLNISEEKNCTYTRFLNFEMLCIVNDCIAYKCK